MKTVTLDRARYTVRDDRHSFLSDILKLTGKHKPVRPRGGEPGVPPGTEVLMVIVPAVATGDSVDTVIARETVAVSGLWTPSFSV